MAIIVTIQQQMMAELVESTKSAIILMSQHGMLCFLLDGDLVDTALVTATLVGGRQEGLDHGDGFLIGDEAARHGQDVGIVVLTGQACDRETPAQGRTDTLMLVEGDVDALATATHGDAGIALALLDCQRAGMGKVRVVTTVLVVGAEVLAGDTLPLEPALDGFLDGIASVVAAQGDGNVWF